MGYCCFWWCFYRSVWSDHHISSFYLVWELTSQFWVQWWRFWRQWVTVVFYDVSIHHYGQIIIYHHCIKYGRWRPNFGGSGHAFECNGFLLFFMMFSLHHYGQIIIYHHFIWYERWRPNFGCSGHAFGGWLVHWMVYFVHLVNRVIWSSGHMYLW